MTTSKVAQCQAKTMIVTKNYNFCIEERKYHLRQRAFLVPIPYGIEDKTTGHIKIVYPKTTHILLKRHS